MRSLDASLLACCAMALAAGQSVDPGISIVKDFEKRVADYVSMQKTIQGEVHGLKPTNSADAITQHEHRLARRIREARRTAMQGNIFTPAIEAEFQRLIGLTMKGPEAGPIRESLQHSGPLAPRAIRVNASYPAATPLQSTPPSLLLNLPILPAGLEYRLVGNALILRDREANLIVDFIPNAIP